MGAYVGEQGVGSRCARAGAWSLVGGRTAGGQVGGEGPGAQGGPEAAKAALAKGPRQLKAGGGRIVMAASNPKMRGARRTPLRLREMEAFIESATNEPREPILAGG
jgi:hypothetical protein